jgi:hypothetical protein
MRHCIWKSLKTDRISVAKLRLGDFHKGKRQRASAQAGVTSRPELRTSCEYASAHWRHPDPKAVFDRLAQLRIF